MFIYTENDTGSDKRTKNKRFIIQNTTNIQKRLSKIQTFQTLFLLYIKNIIHILYILKNLYFLYIFVFLYWGTFGHRHVFIPF